VWCVCFSLFYENIWVGLCLVPATAEEGAGWQRMVGCLLSLLATCCLPSSVPFTFLSATVHLLPYTCHHPPYPPYVPYPLLRCASS
jgi:hypothetical protein